MQITQLIYNLVAEPPLQESFFWQYLNEAGTVQENHRKLSGGTMPRSPLPRIIQPSKYMQARIQYT